MTEYLSGAERVRLQKAIILMGSKSDLEFCEKIKASLSSYSIASEL